MILISVGRASEGVSESNRRYRFTRQSLIEKGPNEASGVGLRFTLDALFVSDLREHEQFSNSFERATLSGDRW